MSTIKDIEKDLKESGFDIDRERIQKALDELVADGLVEKDIEQE